MHIALHGVTRITDAQARFAHQMGVPEVNLNQYWPSFAGEALEEADMRTLREAVEARGLRVGALENVPPAFYDRIMTGRPGREEQMQRLQRTVRNVARAGIRTLGFHFMATGVWRTNQPLDAPPATIDPARVSPQLSDDQYPVPRVGRGGAGVSTFDRRLVASAPIPPDGPISEERMWDNFAYFIRGIMPVAEEEGLRIALHPDDPPVPSLGGIARPFRSFEGFRRAAELAESPLFGLTFCLGNWILMGREDLFRGIEYFGSRGLIHYAHVQAVRGTPERYEETFFDQGDLLPEAIAALRDIGFDGALVPGHPPVTGAADGPFEDPWRQDLHGMAHSIGFIQGLLQARVSRRPPA